MDKNPNRTENALETCYMEGTTTTYTKVPGGNLAEATPSPSLFSVGDVNYLLPFALVTSLFFIWGLANNMTDTLLAAFSKIMEMTSVQTSFIQMAFYGAYFCFALPTALFIRRFSYRAGIVTGLALFATGGFLFYPAGEAASYPFYLLAIYILAAGCSILETTANPFVLAMGPEATATRRLNLAQSFNPIGSIAGLLISKYFILSSLASDASRGEMNAVQLAENRQSELFAVSAPYFVTGGLMLIVMLVFAFYRMPQIQDRAEGNLRAVVSRLYRNKVYRYGVVAQFFYVGAQICVWSYLIQYVCAQRGISPGEASQYSVISVALFTGARFLFTALMRYIAPARLLLFASTAAALCTFEVITGSGMPAIIALVGISFFMSLMFPTIYGLALEGIGGDSKFGASGLIMSILGGALFPLAQGAIATNFPVFQPATGTFGENFALSYVVPLACFAVVIAYSWFAARVYNS